MSKKFAELLNDVVNANQNGKVFEELLDEKKKVKEDDSEIDNDEDDEEELDEKAVADSKKIEKIKKAKAWMKANKASKEEAAAEFDLSVKDLHESADEDDDDEDEISSVDDDENLKEAMRLYKEEVGDDDDLDEGRMAHPLTDAEKKLKKEITKRAALIHYYEKGKKAGTKYNNTKGRGGDVNNLKKEYEILKAQFKALRKKSHPKSKSMLNNSADDDAAPVVDVRKVTKEDFDSSDDLAAIFGTDETLSEEFTDKVRTIYEAAVISKANEVVAEIHTELKEAYVREREEFVASLSEAYEAKIEQLEESMDRYLDKAISDWKAENRVAIESRARYEIAESFMSKLKNLFEEHYIDMPDEKYDVLENLEKKVASLEETLENEISKNIELKTIIEEKEKSAVITAMTEGLTESQKEKFMLLAEAIDASGDEFVEKLTEIKKSYFSQKQKRMVEQNDIEDELIIQEDVKPVRYAPVVEGTMAVMGRYFKK